MTDRSDEDEWRELIANAVPAPGMADDVLREMEPLLAAEGVDLHGATPVDISTLSAALASAAERVNFDRFSPPGSARAGALTVLREVTEAIGDGNTDAAEDVLNNVQPEPEEGQPSVANVIGVGVGLLDSWHTDPGLSTAVARSRVPRLSERASASATDILALARKGRGFDAITSLIRKHGGFAVLEGTVLAVAGTVKAWAEFEQSTMREIARIALDGVAHNPVQPVVETRRDGGQAEREPDVVARFLEHRNMSAPEEREFMPGASESDRQQFLKQEALGSQVIAWVFGAADNGRHELTVDSTPGMEVVIFTKEGTTVTVLSENRTMNLAISYAGWSILTRTSFALILRTTPAGKKTHHIRCWEIGGGYVLPLSAADTEKVVTAEAAGRNYEIDPAERYEDAWPLTLEELLSF